MNPGFGWYFATFNAKNTMKHETNGNVTIPMVALIGIFAYCVFISGEVAAVELDGTIWESSARFSDPKLLYAIALQETRSLDEGMAKPRPWVIRHRDTVYEFDSYWEAAGKLDELLAYNAAPKTIDVGIMQINLGWHGHRVEQPMELLIPAINISIADQILSEAQSSTSDAIVGIGRYHSYTPNLAESYGQQVAAIACRLGVSIGNASRAGTCYE